MLLSFVAALACSGCVAGKRSADDGFDVRDGLPTHNAAITEPRTLFLAVGKGRAGDPPRQQERAVAAVRGVTAAAEDFQPAIRVDALTETVMTRDQFRRGEVDVRVNGEILRKRLQELARSTTASDTVIIYTHTHGAWGGPDATHPPGGMVLDPGTRRPEQRGVFTWDEYVELLLDIPAGNVVILTMSCFSGGLVDRLNSPRTRVRWNDRRQEEGRNLVVLTSQNRELMSLPIVIGGILINPFTAAVAEAFSGRADGFSLVDGDPAPDRLKDGKLTIGELVDFILHATENTVSEAAGRMNTAKPQVTGSFNRDDVLLVRSGARGDGR